MHKDAARPSQQETRTVRHAIWDAARAAFPHLPAQRLGLFFEHGHWWLRAHYEGEDEPRTFDVVDAEGVGSYGGFAFEEV